MALWLHHILAGRCFFPKQSSTWCSYEAGIHLSFPSYPWSRTHPEKKFSVLMQPLIDELQTLKDGVLTWDASIKKSFTMKAAYQMSIHDFPALWMFVGWSTHGLLACHRCLGDTKSLHSLRVIRRVGLIVIDVFFPWTMNLEPKVMHLERIQ